MGIWAKAAAPAFREALVFFILGLCHNKLRFIGLMTKAAGVSAWERCEAGPAAPKPMAPGNDATFLWRHAADRRYGAAVDGTRRCRHPGAPALEKTLWSMVTSLKPKPPRVVVVGGCFSLCGRSPLGAPVSPCLAAPLFDSGFAQSHAKQPHGFFLRLLVCDV